MPRYRNKFQVFRYADIHWAQPGDGNWRKAVVIAEKYVKDNDIKEVGSAVRLVKLRVERGKGVVYYMIVEVKGENGISTFYDAKVYRLPGATPPKVEYFTKISDPGMETDGTNVSDEKAKERAASDGKSSSIITSSGKTSDEKASTTHTTMPGVNEGSTELDSEKQIRSERPTSSYAKARKMASSTGGGLPEHEKMTFIGEVAKRQKP